MTEKRGAPELAAVRATLLPYDQWFDWYQEYYRFGIEQYLRGSTVRVTTTPDPLRRKILTGLREARHLTRIQKTLGRLAPAVNSALDATARVLGGVPKERHEGVGSYRFVRKGAPDVLLRLDSSDAGELALPEAADACDAYLKCNYWPTKSYPPTIVPFYNCNPVVLPHLQFMREARRVEKEYDCCFIVRVWGGRQEEEGVEHCIQMLEALARVPGKNYVLGYLVAGDIPALEKRLRQLGIASTTRPIPPRELWTLAAKSRVNVIRLGMFHCIPWRMTDMLAMGCCILLDQPPKTHWPVPLIEDTHYGALMLETSEDSPLAAPAEYERATEKVAAFAADRARADALARNAAEYFDTYLSPEAIGRAICDIALTRRM